MKTYNWYSCPSNHPIHGYLCCKPMYHSGKCVAEFSNSVSKTSWFAEEGVQDSTLMHITVTEQEVKDYNLEKHMDAAKEEKQTKTNSIKRKGTWS